MRTKFTLILIILCFVSLLLATWCFNSWQHERKERQRADVNLLTLSTEYRAFKDTSFARIGILSMEVNEVKRYFPELEKTLKNEFNTKLKNAIQVSQTTAVVNTTFKTFVKDSTIIDSIPLHTVNYTDSFTRFRAVEYAGEFTVNENRVRVPLIQVTSREPWNPKYLLPWNWNKSRPIYQDVKSTNPNAIIEFSRTLNILHK